MTMEFEAWPKIRRGKDNGVIVTEKIDGTNAQIAIEQDGTTMHVGSRNRWITPEDDNFGFARWAAEHRDELLTLGPGRHFGEWWARCRSSTKASACPSTSITHTRSSRERARSRHPGS
jgi:hypothetical protein